MDITERTARRDLARLRQRFLHNGLNCARCGWLRNRLRGDRYGCAPALAVRSPPAERAPISVPGRGGLRLFGGGGWRRLRRRPLFRLVVLRCQHVDRRRADRGRHQSCDVVQRCPLQVAAVARLFHGLVYQLQQGQYLMGYRVYDSSMA